MPTPTTSPMLPLQIILIDNKPDAPMWLTREFKPVAYITSCQFAPGRYRAFIVMHTANGVGIREYSLIPSYTRAVEMVNDAIAEQAESQHDMTTISEAA